MRIQILFSLFNLAIVLAIPASLSLPTYQQINSMNKVAALNKANNDIAMPNNTTENGLSGLCRPVTTLFARGTGESGNVGDGGSPGPAWFSEMRKSIGEENIVVQGIDYNANVFGYLIGGDPEGSQRFLDTTNEAAIKCPDTKIVIGGYSQGAQLAHNAAKRYSPSVTSRIVAAVLFGDPYTGQELGQVPSAAVLGICHEKDIICRGYGDVSDHLNYAADAPKAATFVVQRLEQHLRRT